MLIPSIDLYDGKAVQWRKGKEPVLQREDVFELLEEFSLYGEVAIIDLNAATGKGDNRELICELLKKRRCRVGGGIRDIDSARFYLKAGASKIILGTACKEAWVDELPKNTLVFAIDAKGDDWTTEGWQKESGEKVADLIAPLAQRCSEFLYTQVEKEGMMQGLDRDRVEQVVKASAVPVTVAGGISSPADMAYLSRLGANGQIGMAIYSGAMTLEDTLVECIDFEKMPLVPTIVQDAKSKDVLMLAYSNEQSLRTALQEARGVYWSRSRQEIWRKGETSGHIQKLINVDFDCDGDTLLFTIEQTDQACHLNRWSCFPTQQNFFDLNSLDQVLTDRRDSEETKSFGSKLMHSQALRDEKLREECEEVIEATAYEEVRWEAADALFFLLAQAKGKGVDLKAIIDELRARHK